MDTLPYFFSGIASPGSHHSETLGVPHTLKKLERVSHISDMWVGWGQMAFLHATHAMYSFDLLP